jgi:hypothetical protein
MVVMTTNKGISELTNKLKASCTALLLVLTLTALLGASRLNPEPAATPLFLGF